MSKSGAHSFSIFLILCLCSSWHNTNAQQFTEIITSTDNRQVTVELGFFPIRSPNFGVLVQQESGSFTQYSPAQPRTYLGTVRGYTGAMAAALRKPDGKLLCRISFEDGSEWSTTGGAASVWEPGWKPQWPTTVIPPTTSNSVLYSAEVGVDASYAAFTASGSDIQTTVDMVEFSVLAANMPFLRDASILHRIGKLLIRSSSSRDPYPSQNTQDLLDKVRAVWNTELASIVGNTHHLGMVTRPGAGGGLAYVGVVVTSPVWAYSANGADSNGDFSGIWRHEAGHNWGSNHYEGGGNPEGPTIMSNNQLSRFSSSELLTILNQKAKIPQLGNTSLVISRPPRANMDAILLTGRQGVSLDVLANDLDADYRALKISSARSPTPAGGSIQISRPGGGSRDQIVYTPSAAAAVSGDWFSYAIQNTQGKTSTGYVILTPESLVGWWNMDETSGNSVKDSSRNLIVGNVTTGSATWNQGLVFNGATTVSLGTKASLSGQTSFSISLWVKTTSSSSSNSVLIQQRSPPNSASDGFNGEYQVYLQGGARPSLMVFGNGDWQFDFSSTTSVNDGQWHHILAIRDGSEGLIFIDGRLSASASNFVKSLDGNIPVFLGSDARDNVGFFTGTLSGVRIFKRALSADEISYLSTRPEALLGWWKLDEKNGLLAQDSSANEGTGTISGTTSWETQGEGGLIFQGAGKVSFGTVPSLVGKTSFSIHAWVKVPANVALSKGIIIQQRGPMGFNGEYQLYLRDGNKPALMVFGDGAWQFDFSTSAGINDGQWHHIIAVREGNEGRIYVDGRLAASANGEVRSLSGTIAVYMGWDSLDQAAFLRASVRDVKIYNRVVVVTPRQSLQQLLATS